MTEWRCCNGHVLGLVKRSGRYHSLLLIDPRLPESQTIIASITGGAEVRCLICGDVRAWHFVCDGRRVCVRESVTV